MRVRQISIFAVASALSMLSVLNASASDFSNMVGVWKGSYLAVSPGRDGQPGPRFNQAEMVMEIKEQNENAFWGSNKWRVVGRDNWREGEVSGSLSLHDAQSVSIMEKSSNPDLGIVGSFEGRLIDGKLYLNFQGLRTGTVYSTVLERSPGAQ